MSVAEWGIIAGVVTSALLALGPWMFMVHARLAVLVAQVAGLDAKVDRICRVQDERLAWCMQHQAAIEECSRRLQLHEARLVQLGELAE